jgi:hypothetical protein
MKMKFFVRLARIISAKYKTTFENSYSYGRKVVSLLFIRRK